jgi:hypothetical protein
MDPPEIPEIVKFGFPFHREVNTRLEKTHASHFMFFLQVWIEKLYEWHKAHRTFTNENQVFLFNSALKQVESMGIYPFQVYDLPIEGGKKTQTFYLPAGLTPVKLLRRGDPYGQGMLQSFSKRVNWHHINQEDDGPIVALPREIHNLTFTYDGSKFTLDEDLKSNLYIKEIGAVGSRNMLHRIIKVSNINRGEFRNRVIQVLNLHYDRTHLLPRNSDGFFSPYGGETQDQYNSLISLKGSIPRFNLYGNTNMYTPEKK